MNRMPQNDHELMSIAVMHDLVEDTHWTITDLVKIGFSNRVVMGVADITHDKDEPYDDYIKRVALNEDSRLAKIEDLGHNSDIRRIKGLRKKDFDRLEKYHRAYEYLKR